MDQENSEENMAQLTDIVEENDLEINERTIFEPETYDLLFKLEVEDPIKYLEQCSKVKDFFKTYDKVDIKKFDSCYKKYKESRKKQNEMGLTPLKLPDMKINYFSKSYIYNNGCILEVLPSFANITVAYQPLIPIEVFINEEDKSERVKLAYYKNGKWENMIFDRATLASSAGIIKLADFGITVNSETAKHLVKYLTEIEFLNKASIKTSNSTLKLGWIGDELMPYSDKYEFVGDREVQKNKELFGEKGKLEEWIEFFRNKRSKNPINSVIMAAALSGILLKFIEQPGFMLHLWGKSECGKTVSSMAAQSIFGNPEVFGGKGIGINFNSTNLGIELVLGLYNNLPVFINEMEHQKDAFDFDKLIYLISEGKGRTKSTKNGDRAKFYTWNTVAITNGEHNIIRQHSNEGAYNRCISIKADDKLYDDLPEVADFTRGHYGTPIREILRELPNIDVKQIYKDFLKKIDVYVNSTSKQRIILAIILAADKILTDILFKDEAYLDIKLASRYLISKDEIDIGLRALEAVKGWYISKSSNFDVPSESKSDIFGRTYEKYVAFIPGILENFLKECGFNSDEVYSSWRNKGILKIREGDRCWKCPVRIDSKLMRCIVVNLDYYEKNEIADTVEKPEDAPF